MSIRKKFNHNDRKNHTSSTQYSWDVLKNIGANDSNPIKRKRFKKNKLKVATQREANEVENTKADDDVPFYCNGPLPV